MKMSMLFWVVNDVWFRRHTLVPSLVRQHLFLKDWYLHAS